MSLCEKVHTILFEEIKALLKIAPAGPVNLAELSPAKGTQIAQSPISLPFAEREKHFKIFKITYKNLREVALWQTCKRAIVPQKSLMSYLHESL